MRAFASDNYAPAHPEVLEAIARANVGHARAYGADEVTARLEARVREAFGPAAHCFPVFNGTGANVTSLQAALRPWEAVICSVQAHINVDEGGAPERTVGAKLIPLPTRDGRLTPQQVEAAFIRPGDEHYAQPRVVSVTQSTEYGTVYPLLQLRAIADVAHAHGGYLHVDGARLANAAVSLGVDLGEITARGAVDILSFGGTKNGALGAEAVVVFNPALAAHFKHVRKTLMQLNSKMRFTSAQLLALLSGDLWRRNAANANAMAQRLAKAVAGLPDVELTQPVEANAVFARIPQAVIDQVPGQFPFYMWDDASREARWMCSWDTTEDDVDAFAAAIRRCVRPA
jgi:threonine aldolase